MNKTLINKLIYFRIRVKMYCTLQPQERAELVQVLRNCSLLPAPRMPDFQEIWKDIYPFT